MQNSLSNVQPVILDTAALSQPPTYEGEFNARKLNDWLATMEIYLEARRIPKQEWVATSATYFRGVGLSWFRRWREEKLLAGEPLVWEDLAKKCQKDMILEDLEWEARVKLVTLEFRGTLPKHIDIFHRLSQEIHDMNVPEAVFHFIRSLPKKLATKLAEKRKSFETLNECFDQATHLAVNKPHLVKMDEKNFNSKKGESRSDKSEPAKILGSKRPSEGGVKEGRPSNSRPWMQKEGFAPKKARFEKAVPATKWTKTQDPTGDNCFKCGKPGHRKRECPDLKRNTKFNSTRTVESEDQVRTSFPETDDPREPSGNAPLVMDLPEEDAYSFPELFFVDVLIGKQIVPAMIDTGASKNFMSEKLCERLGLEKFPTNALVSCQFSNGDFGFITESIPRVKLEFTGVGRQFICNEEIMVLKSTGIELVLSIEFLTRYSIAMHPKQGFLLVPDGKGNFLEIFRSRLLQGDPKHSLNTFNTMAKVVTPKQLQRISREDSLLGLSALLL